MDMGEQKLRASFDVLSPLLPSQASQSQTTSENVNAGSEGGKQPKMKDGHAYSKLQDMDTVKTPSMRRRKSMRILDRRGILGQSRGTWKVGIKKLDLYREDLFHSLIHVSSSKLFLFLVTVYLSCVGFFAIVYFYIGHHCNLAIDSFREAWLFSVETIATIGYSAPGNDIFYDDCASMAFLITAQSFAGCLLDAVIVGLFYARFSRAQTRASTVIFSHKAVIRKIRGDFYFMFQFCESRKHQLIEAHIRCYAIRKVRAEMFEYEEDNDLASRKKKAKKIGGTSKDKEGGLTSKFRNKINAWSPSVHIDRLSSSEEFVQTHAMRLINPNDELGGMVLMAFPSTVVHKLDAWSPLVPPKPTAADYDPTMQYRYPDVLQREVDTSQGAREGRSEKPTWTEDEIRDFIDEAEIEIVVILEGIDPPTSSTVQARQSYVGSEIEWNAAFTPCVLRQKDGSAVVDFSRFNETVPVPKDAATAVSSSVSA